MWWPPPDGAAGALCDGGEYDGAERAGDEYDGAGAECAGGWYDGR